MVDTARYFVPIPNLQSTIRGMQVNKLNVLHLHLTDSESFPLQLIEFSIITQYGAYSKDEIYTQEEMRDLFLYA